MNAAIAVLLGMSILAGPPDALLDQHDLVWEKPPVEWNTGIPLANGAIGALVWGDGAPLKITLDKYDAWETREKGIGDLTYAKLRQLVAEGKREEAEQCLRTQHIYGGDPYPTRLPMPRMELDFGGEFLWDFARLRLRDATARLEGSVEQRPAALALIVHANQNVIEIRLEGAAQNAGLSIGLDHLNDEARATLERWGYPPPETTASDTGGTFLQRTPRGYAYAIAWRRDADRIVLALLSTEDADDPLAGAVALVQEPVDLADHAAWWAAYWDRSWIAVPEARFEALYYAEMYKLACSSRPGHWPATLQGLWTLDGGMPPWSGDYHLDMNVQQTYWPVYTANRLDLGEPLYTRFSACLPRWQAQCQEFFGFDGIWPGCAIGPRGERIFGYSGVELWPGNAAWLAHNFWLHWRYSMDTAFLREHALPMMRLSFLTYANMLEKGEDGNLHVPLSYSPEYHEGSFNGYDKDPTTDLALIRWLGQSLLDAFEVLGEEDPLIPRIRETLDNLAPYPTVNNRLMISANQPFDHSHRHHSHLMGLHPLGVLDPGNPGEAPMIAASLQDIRRKGVGEWTGWAFPWMSLIASRADNGNMAWQMLDIYANSFIKPNTFHVNGDPRQFGLTQFAYEPMTLEAGFGAAAALMEMLLQSHGGVIRVFPTMPDRWHDAYFENLRAEGAFVVTAKMTWGRVQYVKIVAERGGVCVLVNPWEGELPLVGVDASAVTEDGHLRFEMQPGDVVALRPATSSRAGEEPPMWFKLPEEQRHFYGVKRLPRF